MVDDSKRALKEIDPTYPYKKAEHLYLGASDRDGHGSVSEDIEDAADIALATVVYDDKEKQEAHWGLAAMVAAHRHSAGVAIERMKERREDYRTD